MCVCVNMPLSAVPITTIASPLSVHYPTHSIQYSKLCGRVIGYQVGDTNGLGVFPKDDINSAYVDGISLTHGTPRQHIWTFGASRDTATNDCRCNRLRTFVMEHYFCDTANTDSGGLNGQSSVGWRELHSST